MRKPRAGGGEGFAERASPSTWKERRDVAVFSTLLSLPTLGEKKRGREGAMCRMAMGKFSAAGPKPTS